MARRRHMAIATNDPEKTAAFYQIKEDVEVSLVADLSLVDEALRPPLGR